MDIATCYRHSDRPARIQCQRCSRYICPECMTPGSVGFHCPECLSAAPKPKIKVVNRSSEKFTSLVLIGINLVVWLGIVMTGMGSSFLIDVLGFIPQGYCYAGGDQILLTDAAGCAAEGLTWTRGFATGAVWQPITSAFTHIEVWHIGFNMMALWILGPQVEYVLGRGRFLSIYLFSALTASIVVAIFAAPFATTLGASGAIFGMMGAFLVLALKRRSGVEGILVWLGLNVVITFTIPNVSWEGHLGGLLGGALITALFANLPIRKQKLQWPLVVGLFVLAAAALAGVAMLRF